jgi:hypothetical protein
MTIATQQQGNIVPKMKDSEVILCADAYLEDLLIDDSWLVDVGVVNNNIAINGINGDPYINSLPMSTSGGFFFPGAKRQHFDVIIEEDLTETYVPDSEVLDMIHHIETTYAMGNRASILFNGTLKDEPLKQSKVDSGKTRVFTACDVAFSIVVRKQYIKVVRAFMKNNFISECAVGMNPYSLDWDYLYKYLIQHGTDKMIAGDYASYDKSMPPLIIRASFYVLDSLRGDISPLDTLISHGIATDISFPITNMNGDLIQFFGGNSSGHPLTVIINSIANSLYMRLAFNNLQFDLKLFKKHVALMTLGDDNIMGSSLPGFNHTSISESLKTYGITYTMADKETKSIPFINITDCDFLKRSFLVRGERCLGPIHINSVLKSLCMYVDRNNITHEQQLAESYLAARRELSLHGEETFVYYTTILEKILDNHLEVRRFFIDKHSFNFRDTLMWVLDVDTLDNILD